MKKLLFLLTLIITTPLSALIGRCYVNDNGSLTKPDYKKRRFFECYCECKETHNPHTKCMCCDHYHEGNQMVIVQQNEIPEKPCIGYVPRDSNTTLTLMIKNYQKKH